MPTDQADDSLKTGLLILTSASPPATTPPYRSPSGHTFKEPVMLKLIGYIHNHIIK